MKDESKNMVNVVQKFCGEEDKVMAGKPCENCTCGKKEYHNFPLNILDSLKELLQLKNWRLVQSNQAAENAILEMLSDVPHVPTLVRLPLKLVIRFYLRTPQYNRTKLRENKLLSKLTLVEKLNLNCDNLSIKIRLF